MFRTGITCFVLLVLPIFALADDFERGKDALTKNNYELAISYFSSCIQENPKKAAAFIGRGAAYSGQKEYDKAIEDFSEALRLETKYASAFANRGFAYFSK